MREIYNTVINGDILVDDKLIVFTQYTLLYFLYSRSKYKSTIFFLKLYLVLYCTIHINTKRIEYQVKTICLFYQFNFSPILDNLFQEVPRILRGCVLVVLCLRYNKSSFKLKNYTFNIILNSVGKPGAKTFYRKPVKKSWSRAVKHYLVGAGKNPLKTAPRSRAFLEQGVGSQAFFRGNRSREPVKKGTGSPTLI